jgi:hypothetical protein
VAAPAQRGVTAMAERVVLGCGAGARGYWFVSQQRWQGRTNLRCRGPFLPLANVAAFKGSRTSAASAVTLSSWLVCPLYGIFGTRRADRSHQRSSGYKTKKLTPHRTLHNKPEDPLRTRSLYDPSRPADSAADAAIRRRQGGLVTGS